MNGKKFLMGYLLISLIACLGIFTYRRMEPALKKHHFPKKVALLYLAPGENGIRLGKEDITGKVIIIENCSGRDAYMYMCTGYDATLDEHRLFGEQISVGRSLKNLKFKTFFNDKAQYHYKDYLLVIRKFYLEDAEKAEAPAVDRKNNTLTLAVTGEHRIKLDQKLRKKNSINLNDFLLSNF